MVKPINPAIIKELYQEIKNEFQEVEGYLSAEGLKRFGALFGENINNEDRKEIKRIFSEMGITVTYLERTLYDNLTNYIFTPSPGFMVDYFSDNININEILKKIK